VAQKYMILKVLIPNLNRIGKSTKGFTLMELIIGLSIMTIIGSLAMNMLIHASNSFNTDQKSINSSQNLSAILEIIGNDIRQSGENINDANFPVIEFNVTNLTDDPGSMPGSSKVTVRRALTSRLTLCGAFTPTTTSIVVANNQAGVIGQSANCDIGTQTSPLSIYRVPPAPVPPATTSTPTTYYPITSGTPIPTTPAPLALRLPVELRKVRDYRCNTDPNIAYDTQANAGNDFCPPSGSLNSPSLRIALSSSDGQLLIFNQTDEVAEATNETSVKASGDTTSTKRYSITVNRTFNTGNATAMPPIPPDPAIASNVKNSNPSITYNIGDPIYVLEERVYTLTDDGSFNVSVNGAQPQTLIKKIANFRVSARVYTNALERTINPNPASDVCTNPTGTTFIAQPASPGDNNPKYICKFNYFTGVAPADKANWKTLAGVKVELQAKYDGTGKDAEHPTNSDLDSAQVKEDKKKLVAVAEYFPRNVLSK
jgi:prepilin-type N-terminal cleavage/methylation domain-containing protein